MSSAEDLRESSWIAQLLNFTRAGDVFTAVQPGGGPGSRLFGGLIAAQALAAAGGTVEPAKLPQSLHLYFVRGGQYGVDVEFHVEHTRDGRAFDTRRVTARQQGKTILEMIASFHLPEPGATWQRPEPVGIELDDAITKTPDLGFASKFDIKVTPSDDSAFAVPPMWIKTQDRIEDDPLIQACMLTFMSDFGPVPVAKPAGVKLHEGFAASLDHAVWFHRPFVPHEWHRYEVIALGNADSRGLVRGSMYDTGGVLIASTSQEALWRL